MTSITRNSGYITSLHYPRGYTPLASCSCNLTALDPDTNIRFQTLDIDLSPRQRLTVGHDWLEYTQTLDQWGDGYKLNHVIRGDFIDTELPVVYLNFRTGAAVGGRGFWIQYYGGFNNNNNNNNNNNSNNNNNNNNNIDILKYDS